MIKYNLGCGEIRPIGWVNTNSSINDFIQKNAFGRLFVNIFGSKKYNSSNSIFMNLNKKWKKIKDDSVDIIYASICLSTYRS